MLCDKKFIDYWNNFIIKLQDYSNFELNNFTEILFLFILRPFCKQIFTFYLSFHNSTYFFTTT